MLDIQLLVIAISAVSLIFIAVTCFLTFGNRERSFENASSQKRDIYGSLVQSENHEGSSHTVKKTNTKNAKRKKAGVPTMPTHGSSNEHKKPVAKKVTAPEDSTNIVVDGDQDKETNTLVYIGQQEHAAKKIKSSASTSVPDAPKVDDVSINNVARNIKQKDEHLIPTLPENLPSSLLPPSASIDSTCPAITAEGATCVTTKEHTGVKVIKNRVQAKDTTLETPKVKSKQDSEEILSLKKTLEEKERFIQQQKEKLAKLTSTVKELKHEMFNEKQKQTDDKQSFDEQLKKLGSETENLRQSLREAQSQLSFKVHTCHQLESQVLKLQENVTKMHQVSEENRRLKDCLKSNEHETLMHNNEFHRLQQELINCKAHIHKLEQQRDETEKMRAVQDANFAMQLMESQGALLAKDNECAKLVEDLKTLRNEISLMEQDHRSVRQEFTQKEALMQTVLSQKAIEADMLQESRKNNVQLIEKENILQSEIKSQRHMIGELTTKQKQDQALYSQICAVKDANIEELNRRIDTLNTELNAANARNVASSEPDITSVRYSEQHSMQVSGQRVSSLLNGSASPGVQEDAQEENDSAAQTKPKNLQSVMKELECSNAELSVCKEEIKHLHDKNLLLRNEKHQLASIVQKTEKLVNQMLHNETKVASVPKSPCSEHFDRENSHFRDRCGYYEGILKKTECQLQSLEAKARQLEVSYENDVASWKNKQAQLQNDLGQRGQHLEKEMAINKQLNDKLASLGITFTS